MNTANEHGVAILANRRWRISGGLAVALGAIVLFGWYTGIATLVQVHPSFVPMQYNTALCFMLCGFGVLFFDRRPTLTTVFASVAALVALLTFGEYFFEVELGLDQLFMRHYITVETSHPGRMAPNTAMCFTLTGVALVVAAGTKGRAVRTIGILALSLIVLGSVALIGYPAALKSSYAWGGLTSMAVHTAFGFMILGGGLFWAAWVHGLGEYSITATASMFGAGATIVLWHVTGLHNALERAMTGRADQLLNREMDGTVALVSIAGVLGTGAVALLVRQLRKNAALLESRVAERTRELDSQKYALDEHALVSITDPWGRITYANDNFCRIAKCSREELIGQDHRIVNSGYHSRAFWADAWKTIGTGKVWRAEVCNRAKDGSLYWVDTTIVPFKDDDGRILQYVAIRADITERKKAEEGLKMAKTEAEAANRAKSEFLANVSHEIRTPMTAILGFAENLLDGNQSESEKLNCIHTIRRNGQSLLGIINDILDLSKIESGKMDANRVACKPCDLIAEVSTLVRVQAEAKGLPFHIEYDGAIPETIRTDAARLRQILINLIGNAIKFTEAGAIRLVTRFVDNAKDDRGASPKGPSLQFDVIDTGRGMAEADAANLFQPFMQADTSATRRIGGTGLGLTIGKRFAELLGGGITVVETTPGVGSTFRATVATGSLDGVMMIEDPQSATVVAEDANAVARAPRSDLRGLRILLAEDVPDNQRVVSLLLKKAGANVTIEKNDKLALDAALAARDEDKPFDVILMDMQMPAMNAYEATRRLRQRGGHTGPIIALTENAMETERENRIKAGCDDCVTKPVDGQRLIDLILEHVDRHRRKTESHDTVTTEQDPLKGCRILLADDNSTNQVLVVGILKKTGAEVTVVKDGKLALDAALAARDDGHPFDIILMDIQMPLMSGDEATKTLRKIGYTGKIISLSANTGDGDQQRYSKTGFDDSAWKPINRAKLIETIHHQWVGAEAVPARAT